VLFREGPLHGHIAGGSISRLSKLSSSAHSVSASHGLRHPQDLDLVFKRLEIRHDIHDLTRRKLKSRHCRMDSLKQRSLHVCNWISETQCAKWGSIGNRALTNFADGMTL
jgi:hypothetical protein